jgi:hypothetical protein
MAAREAAERARTGILMGCSWDELIDIPKKRLA